MARRVIEDRVVVICDSCGREYNSKHPDRIDEEDLDKALHRPKGWKAEGGLEVCPDCKEAE